MKKINLLLMTVLCIMASGCAKYDSPEKDNLNQDSSYASNNKSSESTGIIVINPTMDYLAGSQRGDNSSDPIVFTGSQIVWYNQTTKELRFKDNYAMQSVFSGCQSIAFYVNDEYLFSSTIYVSSVNSGIYNSLVLYYNAIENKYFLKDGYPDASVIGGFISLETAPGIFIEVPASPDIIQALRDENMQKIADEWEQFINQLEKERRLIL